MACRRRALVHARPLARGRRHSDARRDHLGGLPLSRPHARPRGVLQPRGPLRAGRRRALRRASVGRTDFPRGSFPDLVASITGKLWPLGDDVTFVPFPASSSPPSARSAAPTHSSPTPRWRRCAKATRPRRARRRRPRPRLAVDASASRTITGLAGFRHVAGLLIVAIDTSIGLSRRLSSRREITLAVFCSPTIASSSVSWLRSEASRSARRWVVRMITVTNSADSDAVPCSQLPERRRIDPARSSSPGDRRVGERPADRGDGQPDQGACLADARAVRVSTSRSSGVASLSCCGLQGGDGPDRLLDMRRAG